MKLAELRQIVRAADPAAVLVSPAVMNRLIQQVCKLPGFLWEVPHRRSIVLDRRILFRHVEQDDLDLEPDRLLPPTVILISHPSPEQLAAQKNEVVLLKFWRRLFHATLHQHLETRYGEGQLTVSDIRQRIEQIGRTEFEEIRLVLSQDNYLLPPADEQSVYIEFAAVYLELRFFAANLLPSYFPGVGDFTRIDQLLAQDVDAAALFAKTRLAGAPDPVVQTDTRSDESHDYYWRLIRNAEKAGRSGNTVRAAILRTKAARVAPASLTKTTRDDAEGELLRLTRRLQAALQLSDDEVKEWLKDLPALLDKADQGSRPVEAALLYDLQQVCLDHERDIYALDLVEWWLSAAKRPIKRPLPSQRLVRITKHLRNVAQRLTMARLSDVDRGHLGQLLQAALRRSEDRLRDRIRPVLIDAFYDVGLQPANIPERTAFQKVIEELLDRITEFGFLTLSDLRDTLSRNQLKLPDLAEPQEFVRGDPLLRLDRRLAALLDGVYRRGEFYLRWMERLTSLNFGTGVGRWITRNITLPFGGALVILEGLQWLLDLVGKYAGWNMPVFGPLSILLANRVPPKPWWVMLGLGGGDPHVPIFGPMSGLLPLMFPIKDPHSFLTVSGSLAFAVLGLFLLALLRTLALRDGFRRAGKLTYRSCRWLLIDVPAWIWGFPMLRRFLKSWPFQLFYWYFLKPALASVLLRLLVPHAFNTLLSAASIFLAVNFILNSRLGQAVAEGTTQALFHLVELLRAGLLPGLVRLVINLFKQIMDTVEYVLATVDEWLRFRAEDSRLSMILRALLGVCWFPVSYLARFYTVVLIEPGFNPIKAPFSLMAAKFIVPFTGATMWELLDRGPDMSLLSILAWAMHLLTLWLLPDAFTFLFWEMKENWKLYRANRRPNLGPVPVGSHGETVGRLLHPGFHSGTVPRLFARLRQTERDAAETGNWRLARTCRRSLQEVETTLRRFLARDFIRLVQQSPSWQGVNINVGKVQLASNRIRIELVRAEGPDQSAWLEFHEHAGWLVASLPEPGWLLRLNREQGQAITMALAGLYKLAGVDFVQEQLESNLPPGVLGFDITQRDLILWLDQRHGKGIYYDLIDSEDQIQPRNADGSVALEWPVLPASHLMFAKVPLPWEKWVESWQNERTFQPAPPLFNADVKLLPGVTVRHSSAPAP
jgi:hypothetical protein